MLFAVSLAAGLLLAVAYHGFMTRSQLWLSRHSSRSLPLLSVSMLLLRLTGVAVVVLLLFAYTPLNIIAAVGSFIALFSVLNLYSLYRLTSSWGRRGEVPAEAGN